VADELPSDCDVLIEAGALLRRHGRTICRRTAPRCETCPVNEDCSYFAEHGGA
jgi:endonuclease III